MPSFVLDKCLGAIETIHPLSVPPAYATSAVNVDLSDTEFLRPRAGTRRVNLTSGPAAEVVYLFADNANTRLWAFVAATGTAYYWNGSSWASTSLGSDYSSSSTPHCVAYNGKVFMAFDGTVNRLHVFDGTSVRRVGLAPSVAATVANTGVGTYAATLRYYKIQWRIYSGATGVTSATSELSPAISFTPSGGGTAARVTKPATSDNATHWCVYGSSDGVTYYNISGLIAVGTTTYDDNTDPSAYSGGVIAPEVGLYVPPPSAKFLATNGERIFMAGAYETSAGTGETTPAVRRIWFTRPLGVTDAGDDESITQTATSRYYLDLDNDDGSIITGLSSTLDGSVYVFTSTSVWRLVDTGEPDTPVRAERVVAGAGAMSQYLITTGDQSNTSAVYFMSASGPYRYSPNEGAVFIGADWVDSSPSAVGSARPSYFTVMAWDPVFRRAMLGSSDSMRCMSFSPEYLSNFGGKMRGGWCRHIFAYGSPSFSYTELGSVRAAAVFGGVLYLGGKRHDGVSALPLIFYQSPEMFEDELVAFPGGASVVTGDMMSDPTRNMSTHDMYIWKARAVGASITLASHYGPTFSALVTDSAAAQVGYDSNFGIYVREKVEGTAVADVAALRLTINVSTPVAHSYEHGDAIARVEIPYKVQEAG